jgi:hypothetical protein
MTIAMLLSNALEAARGRVRREEGREESRIRVEN